ncbi:MAG TPA: toll/interleukin-1 receptor domain-containing protein [Tepidisphaeraceae bacterium]|jgi:hypothetical protein|nr:toll/interleukin-1 receptor domain-containing protein [Tepidisphaeraceae bacterium]
MNVFISYSVQDTDLVRQIAGLLRPAVDGIFWWGMTRTLGQELWPQIFSQIDQSEVVLAVITDRAVSRGMPMGVEIGHAKKGGKTIIPLIAPGVKDSDIAFLSGINYQQIDRNNPGPAMRAVRNTILRMKFEGQLKQLKEKQQKEIEQNKNNLVMAAAGVVALIYFLSADKAA